MGQMNRQRTQTFKMCFWQRLFACQACHAPAAINTADRSTIVIDTLPRFYLMSVPLKTDSRIKRDLRAGPQSVTEGKPPLTTGFRASKAAKDKTAL